MIKNRLDYKFAFRYTVIMGLVIVIILSAVVGYFAHRSNYYKTQADTFLGCGDVAARELGGFILTGVQSRLSAVVTSAEFDFINDGHTVIEVQYQGRWTLYDGFLGVVVKQGDRFLSLYQACLAIQSDNYTLESLVDLVTPNIDVAWLECVYQNPLIYDNGYYYTYNQNLPQRIPQYKYLPLNTWLQRFYPVLWEMMLKAESLL